KAEITAFQSNSEGELITAIQQARGVCDGLIINAGAYSHYSYAIRDAIEAAEVPTVEVHLSNIHKRDEFRHKSVLSEVCDGVICGLGKHGYAFAALYLINKLTN
ncbi:MAG: type II 3-dehydroquinate dehydratase, partial [Oscillospiraceae bacterium]|nr:type II 3-dehydroquinate dehydratase [Oscillospiraceae bacterium]